MTKNASSSGKSDERAVAPAPTDLRMLLNVAAPQPDVPALAEKWRDESYTDLKHMKPEDMVVWPIVRLLQAGSPPVQEGRPGARAGQYWDVTNEKVVATPFAFVPIFSYMGRARWPKVGEGDNRPLCRSNDGKVGYGVPGGDCDACPQKKRWVNADDKRPIGDCDEIYNYIAYVFETQEVHSLTFQRTSSIVGRNLTKLIATSRARCFASAYLLGAEPRKSQAGITYQVMRLETFPSGQRRMSLMAREEFAPLVEKLADQAAQLAQLYDAGKIAPIFDASSDAVAEDATFDVATAMEAATPGAEEPKAPAVEKTRADAEDF